MGSLCCVAARPHGSNSASGEWSVGPHDTYWRSNTSLSPPQSRWDYQFQYEGIPNGSNDSNQFSRSSMSSNSKGSRSWLRGNHHPTHCYSASEGAGFYFSSPSDTSLFHPRTPPAVQEISVDDLQSSSKRDPSWRQWTFTPTMEGSSTMEDGVGSMSPRSDGSEFEHATKLNLSTHRYFPGRRSFMSKPIHPLSFPILNSPNEAGGYDVTTLQREEDGSSSRGSSIDMSDVSGPFESENPRGGANPTDGYKCELCEGFLSQRSLWSSRRIIRNRDMPITGVLACRHVFHAECLEQTTPKARKSDPPCPLCLKWEEENSPEQFVSPRLKNSTQRCRPFKKDGSSKPWGCAQTGDCRGGSACLRVQQRVATE